MEFRKMVTITLYAKQKKRHRCTEQTFGLCGRRRGWDVSREQLPVLNKLKFVVQRPKISINSLCVFPDFYTVSLVYTWFLTIYYKFQLDSISRLSCCLDFQYLPQAILIPFLLCSHLSFCKFQVSQLSRNLSFLMHLRRVVLCALSGFSLCKYQGNTIFKLSAT